MGRTAAATTSRSEGIALVMKQTEIYAKRHSELAVRMGTLNKEIDALKRKHLKSILTAAASAKDARAELKALIEENRAEFEKPKTRTFFGIKVGFRKLIGTLSWDDSEKVVELIEKHLPDQAEVLIKTEKKPLKKPLEQLAAADLKKLGISVGEDSDEVVIAATDGDVEKAVDALLKDSDFATKDSD
jgi:hypothetical protein